MIKIDVLAHHMHHVPALADIWCDVLGRVWIPDVTKEEVLGWMFSWAHTDRLPIAHIALENERPVGVCSLQQNDGIRPDLWPWLCDLCVAKPYQNQGIGQKLIAITCEKAFALGYKKLYLFAFDPTLPAYYGRLGWKVIGEDRHRNHPVTVMAIELSE